MTENPSRESARNAFLQRWDWGGAERIALIPDASFRCYFQLIDGGRKAMLMDAPPEHEDIQPFLDITYHLQDMGLRVPEIYHSDLESGFILLEDLGKDTLTSILSRGIDEAQLYDHAITAICTLQAHPKSTRINTGEFDFEVFSTEAGLLIDWYLPAITGIPTDPGAIATYQNAWGEVFSALPELGSVLVLRDFHVDNLMRVDDQCALLDYQDALIGSPAYDVVSLLEDARRDINEATISSSLANYFDNFPDLDRDAFMHHYQVWGAQRHAKVLGIFVRLWLRDNKPVYLEHLSRVWSLLMKNLESPPLAPVRQWLYDNRINPDFQGIERDRNTLLEQLGLAEKNQ